MYRLPILLCLAAVFCLSQAQDVQVNVVDPSTLEPSTGSRIVGGTPTTIEEYPYAVQVIQGTQLICGGSLITLRHVLSAAHCYFIYETKQIANPRLFTIRAGTTSLNSGGQTRSVTGIIVHESYDHVTEDCDVAVLLLPSSFTEEPTVRAASVPEQGYQLADRTSLEHVGWGHTSANGSLSPVLQSVTVRKVSRDVCAARYAQLMAATGHVFVVTSNMICAGLLDVGGADACQGDSGGPLVLANRRMVVVGVTSWGYGCGTPEFPGVSARVSNFTQWIETTVARFNGAPSLTVANCVVIIASLLVSLAVFRDV